MRRMHAHIPRDLAPIPFERVPVTPLPIVIETDWSEWDRAVQALDESTPDGRARALAEAGRVVSRGAAA